MAFCPEFCNWFGSYLSFKAISLLVTLCRDFGVAVRCHRIRASKHTWKENNLVRAPVLAAFRSSSKPRATPKMCCSRGCPWGRPWGRPRDRPGGRPKHEAESHTQRHEDNHFTPTSSGTWRHHFNNIVHMYCSYRFYLFAHCGWKRPRIGFSNTVRIADGYSQMSLLFSTSGVRWGSILHTLLLFIFLSDMTHGTKMLSCISSVI